MAWALLGKRRVAYGERSSFELERPAGAVAGCLLVACMYGSNSNTITETNFTKDKNETFGASERWATFYKIDDGSQKLKVVLSGKNSNECWLMAFSGNAAAPFDASSLRKESGAKAMKTTAVTVAKAGSLLVNMSVEGSATTATPPAGLTEIVDSGTEETYGIHIGWGEFGAGSTGERNFEAAAAVNSCNVLTAFKPLEVAAGKMLGMIV